MDFTSWSFWWTIIPLSIIITILRFVFIKTKMTQWFKNPVLDKRKAADEYVPSKHLNEKEIFYDIKERNKKVFKHLKNLIV